MSQVLEEQRVPAAGSVRPSTREEFNEFNYRPVPIVAVTGIILTLLGSMALFLWIALPIALLGALVSLLALVTIRRSEGAYSGTVVSTLSLLLACGFIAGGLAYQVYLYKTETPEGYQRVSFYRDISEKGVVETPYSVMAHKDVAALDGQKVFLKGFIYPTEKMTGLNKFLLLKDNGQCCFGGKPKLQDRIGVELRGFTFDHTYNKVSLAGTFHLNKNYHGGEGLEPLFLLEADKCTLSASDF